MLPWEVFEVRVEGTVSDAQAPCGPASSGGHCMGSAGPHRYSAAGRRGASLLPDLRYHLTFEHEVGLSEVEVPSHLLRSCKLRVMRSCFPAQVPYHVFIVLRWAETTGGRGLKGRRPQAAVPFRRRGQS